MTSSNSSLQSENPEGLLGEEAARYLSLDPGDRQGRTALGTSRVIHEVKPNQT